MITSQFSYGEGPFQQTLSAELAVSCPRREILLFNFLINLILWGIPLVWVGNSFNIFFELIDGRLISFGR